jgi:hypothetical protein
MWMSGLSKIGMPARKRHLPEMGELSSQEAAIAG